jgi:hypothetical protein
LLEEEEEATLEIIKLVVAEVPAVIFKPTMWVSQELLRSQLVQEAQEALITMQVLQEEVLAVIVHSGH